MCLRSRVVESALPSGALGTLQYLGSRLLSNLEDQDQDQDLELDWIVCGETSVKAENRFDVLIITHAA